MTADVIGPSSGAAIDPREMLVDAFKSVDPTSAGAPLAIAVVGLAGKALERLCAEAYPLTISVSWPAGVPEDVRATLRAQIAGELAALTLRHNVPVQRELIRCCREVVDATIEFARSAKVPAKRKKGFWR